jgi:hypothetical protein
MQARTPTSCRDLLSFQRKRRDAKISRVLNASGTMLGDAIALVRGARLCIRSPTIAVVAT